MGSRIILSSSLDMAFLTWKNSELFTLSLGHFPECDVIEVGGGASKIFELGVRSRIHNMSKILTFLTP